MSVDSLIQNGIVDVATSTPVRPKRKLILKCHLALGDLVCMTSAVRELHRQHPDQFETDVRTPFPDLFWNNPDITSIADPDGELIDMHYDRDNYVSVNQSNQHPVHLIEGYCKHLSNALGLPALRPKELKGHIYLNQEEYGWRSMPHDQHNCQRYWLVCAGGKTDFTTKWWPHEGYQHVVNHFRNRIQFVQVGDKADYHPPLQGVISLVGQTNLRQLVRVVHSSCGVLCGITGLMHLAAAVPLPPWQRRPRPCVVVAGGREPRSWYGYQTHRILETVGSLPCCRDGGCWHARTVPLPDGDEANSRLCERVVNGQPKCMTLIRPESVILEIEKYLESEGIE